MIGIRRNVGLGRKGAAIGATLPLALAAVVSAGVFMMWLKSASTPTEIELTDGMDNTPAAQTTMVREIAFGAYAAGPAGFADQNLRVRDVPVSNIPFGTQGFFWANMGETLTLFRLEGQALTQVPALEVGEMHTVTGMVHTLDDEVLDAWIAEGRVPEDARIELDYVNDYFAVQSVEGAAAAGQMGGAAGSAAADSAGG